MRKGNTLLVDNGNINAWQGGELGSKHKRAAAAAAAAARQSCWFELLYINFQIPGAALKEKAIRHWNRKTYSHAAQMIASRQVDLDRKWKRASESERDARDAPWRRGAMADAD
ncbi:hypothetical protein ACLOJK_028960 [Asimina triloba]